MNFTAVNSNYITGPCLQKPRATLKFLAVLVSCSVIAFGQNASQPTNSPFSVHVTHIMGFEGAANNANGTLSFQDNALKFQQGGKAAVEVSVTSIQDVFLGGESKQVGGLPMTLGKAAVPFGGGRAVSLFTHKKYDTLTLQYVDGNQALHGAIFQLQQGRGQVLKNELVARGAHVSDGENQKSTAEVSNESK